MFDDEKGDAIVNKWSEYGDIDDALINLEARIKELEKGIIDFLFAFKGVNFYNMSESMAFALEDQIEMLEQALKKGK